MCCSGWACGRDRHGVCQPSRECRRIDGGDPSCPGGPETGCCVLDDEPFCRPDAGLVGVDGYGDCDEIEDRCERGCCRLATCATGELCCPGLGAEDYETQTEWCRRREWRASCRSSSRVEPASVSPPVGDAARLVLMGALQTGAVRCPVSPH